MKCEKCGKNDVNFYFSSNINGNVTEKHLCSECAREMNLGGGHFGGELLGFDPRTLFGGFFGQPARQPQYGAFPGFGFMFPAMLMPSQGAVTPEAPQTAPAQEPAKEIKADEGVRKQRELNMLREQMRKAAEAEDFEKAAELRDSIKKLEQENA